jgi:ribonucleoside-diphosphate reductase subunit M2
VFNFSQIWEIYKKAEASFWTAEELDVSNDHKDWSNMSKNERHVVIHILTFFATSDDIINGDLVMKFAAEIQSSEARCFYGFQIAIENIHSEVFSLLIDIYVKEDTEKFRLLKSIECMPCLCKKDFWVLTWLKSKHVSFAERLIAFAVVKSIFCCGSFCSICWLKKRGLLPGLAFASELISRDKNVHSEFSCLIYNKLENQLPQERINEIISSSVEIECEFVNDALPVELIGMNSTLMCQYIKFCADHLYVAVNCPKKYNVSNPFDWAMIPFSLQEKRENRVSESPKSGVGVETAQNTISFDEDF